MHVLHNDCHSHYHCQRVSCTAYFYLSLLVCVSIELVSSNAVDVICVLLEPFTVQVLYCCGRVLSHHILSSLAMTVAIHDEVNACTGHAMVMLSHHTEHGMHKLLQLIQRLIEQKLYRQAHHT